MTTLFNKPLFTAVFDALKAHPYEIVSYRRVRPTERPRHWTTDSRLYEIGKINIDKPIRTYSDLDKPKPTYNRSAVSDFIISAYCCIKQLSQNN